MIIKLVAGFVFALLWLVLLFRFRKKYSVQAIIWLMLVVEALILTLVFWPQKPIAKQAELIILTEGSPDSLAGKEGTYSILPDAAGFTQWVQLSQDSNRNIALYGNGLPADWLNRATRGQLRYYPEKKVSGIRQLQLLTSIALGDTLTLPVWLKARGTSSLSLLHNDSTVWQARVGSDSLLWPKHRPAYSGLQHYQLVFQPTDTVNFYVSVDGPKALTLALFTAYPSAEQKFLTNWLQEEGHRVYAESSLRPGLEFSKTVGSEGPGNLNEAIRQADIFLFDQEQYQRLSRQQKARLKAAVREGKAVIFWPNSGGSLAENTGIAVSGLQQSLQEISAQPLSAIQLPKEAAGETLLRWENGSPAAIRRADGFGRWSWLGVQQSYIWQLQGNTDAYNSLWRKLLRELSPPEEKPRLQITSWPNRVNRALQLNLKQNTLPKPGWLYAPSGDSLQLGFVEKRPHSGSWQATVWPREAGVYRWQQGGQTLYLEVSPANSFPATLQQASLAYVKDESSSQPKKAAAGSLDFWKIVLVGALVLALVAIWAVEKFSKG